MKSKEDVMKSSVMREVVERLVESWNLHDPDAVARCYAPDAPPVAKRAI